MSKYYVYEISDWLANSRQGTTRITLDNYEEVYKFCKENLPKQYHMELANYGDTNANM